jgi:hypothetical protein
MLFVDIRAVNAVKTKNQHASIPTFLALKMSVSFVGSRVPCAAILLASRRAMTTRCFVTMGGRVKNVVGLINHAVQETYVIIVLTSFAKVALVSLAAVSCNHAAAALLLVIVGCSATQILW